MANPTYLGSGAFVTNHTSANRVARPTVSEGDLMIAVIGLPYSDADVTPPSGWDPVTEADPENVFRTGVHVYRKIAGASEAADYLFTISGQGGGNNIGSARIFAWSGVDGTTPINVVATPTVYAASSTSAVCPGVTTTVADCTLFSVVITGDTAARTFSPPSGMTEIADGTGAGGESWAAFYEDLAAAGATGTRTATISTAATYHALTFAIAPAGGGDTTAPVITSVVGTGGAGTSSGSFSSSEAGTAYWKLTATSTPESVPAYPSAMTGWTSMAMVAGVNNIASLTTTPGTYWLQVAAQDDEATPNRVSAPVVSASSFTVTAPPENPVITDQPDNSTVKAGQTATFTVAATGSGTVTYQWQVNTGSGWSNVSNGGAYSGATTATLSVVTARSMTGYQFRCNVSDDDAGPVASSAATLTVQQCVLALDAEAYAFGNGNAPGTMARVASTELQVAAYPLAEWPPAAPVASVTATTGTNGRLADLGDDDLTFGTTYRCIARNAATGETWAWTMEAS